MSDTEKRTGEVIAEDAAKAAESKTAPEEVVEITDIPEVDEENQQDYERLAIQIRGNEDRLMLAFSKGKRFSPHLYKWQDASLADMYDHNAFISLGNVGKDELDGALEYQKNDGKDFLKIISRTRIKPEYVKELELDESVIYVMALPDIEVAKSWKRNPGVTVKDIKDEPEIADDLSLVEVEYSKTDEMKDFQKRKAARYAEVAAKSERFHYCGAYLDGEIAGVCYAFSTNGVLCIDDVVIREKFRCKYTATTMIAELTERFGETVYLHADASDTPKDMYKKMGFKTVDVVYEYFRRIK